MGKYEVYKFLNDRSGEWFKIKELASALGVSERNIRRAVVSLEADREIKGRCRGNYDNWNREYTINKMAQKNSK